MSLLVSGVTTTFTGAVWGLQGKILAFLVSLVSASLPITGFLVWWNNKKKKNKASEKKPSGKIKEALS